MKFSKGLGIIAVIFLIILPLTTTAQTGPLNFRQPQNPNVSNFLSPDGRIDMQAAQAAGYKGALDMQGFKMDFDPKTGAPLFRPQIGGKSRMPGKINSADSRLEDGDDRLGDDSRWRRMHGLYREFPTKSAESAMDIRSIQKAKSHPDDIYWDDDFYGQDLSGDIYAVAIFNGQIIVGGSFAYIGKDRFNYIAAWDGSSWSTLGSGLDGEVYSLIVYKDTLIAGGYFWATGDYMTSLSCIAAWDGNQWASLGSGLYGYVISLTVYKDNLIAGGSFWYDGSYSTELHCIAAWDGASWSTLGGGLDGGVYSLMVYKDTLIAGGYFWATGDNMTSLSCIAAWDGNQWASLGAGLAGGVWTLTVYKDSLIAAGSFWYDGSYSTELHCIAAWDDAQWASLGAGLNSDVCALTVYKDTLVAGGYFSATGDYMTSLSCIAAWDGSQWMPLGLGMNSAVMALAINDDTLIAAGSFTMVDDSSEANKLAVWDGDKWTGLGNISNDGNGVNNYVEALAIYDNKLIAGGAFTRAGSLNVNHIAAWDGSSWSALGGGLNGEVYSLLVYGDSLIAGGYFWATGDNMISLSHIAAWDGAQWASLGSGLDGGVNALTVYQDTLIAGGYFWATGDNMTSLSCIAAWDGAQWSPLGLGLNNGVYALTVYKDTLVAGGYFSATGDNMTSLSYIAAWDGGQWSSLGAGLDGGVYALTVYKDTLIAGGWFYATGDGSTYLRGLGAWDGTQWSPLGQGPYGVYGLAVYKGKLIAGGGFTFWTNYGPVYYIAAWNGNEWLPLGSGMDDWVWCLNVYNDTLFAGGGFTMAGEKPSSRIAAFCPEVPPPPSPPDSMQAWTGCGYIYLDWLPVEGASYYCLYRDSQLLYSWTDTYFYDGNPGTSEHCYYVTAKKSLWDESDPSNTACATAYWPEAPQTPQLTISSDCQYIYLAWGAVENVTYYCVVRDGQQWLDCPSDTIFTDYPQDTIQHCYQVVAYNDCVSSNLSDSVCASLMKAPAKPSRPSVAAKCNAIDISWTVVSGASSYNIYRSGAYLANVIGTSYNDNNPGTSKRYYKLKSVSACDSSAFSDSAGATAVSAAPAKPSKPTITAQCDTINVTWNTVSGASSYEIYRGAELVKTATGTSWKDDSPGIILRYYKIKAKNVCGTSAFSDSAGATAGSKPAAPVLVSPPDKFDNKQGGVIAFDWDDIISATQYSLQISANIAFSPLLKETTTTASSCNISLLAAGTYYWRVKAKNTCGDGDWSISRSLVNNNDVAEIPTSNLPIEYSLTQNYPNPFNLSTRFEFSMPRASDVVIKVYDITGREIVTLADNHYSAGNYMVDWNGEDNFGNIVASGIYLYRIKAGDFVESKKMILLK